MGFETVLSSATMRALRECDSVYCGDNPLEKFMFLHNETINFFYKKEILSEGSLDIAVNDAIIKEARIYINDIVEKDRAGTPIDAHHLPHPEILAYAIDNKLIPEPTIQKVELGKWNPEYFAQVHRLRDADLLSKIREELLHPSAEKLSTYICSLGCIDCIK